MTDRLIVVRDEAGTILAAAFAVPDPETGARTWFEPLDGQTVHEIEVPELGHLVPTDRLRAVLSYRYDMTMDRLIRPDSAA